MNILIDELPSSVEIDGKDYIIRADFRTSILFGLLMQDSELDDEEKYDAALGLYYPVYPHDEEQAIEAICWFYRCGREPHDVYTNGTESAKHVYSMEYDSLYIYAAFMQQYHIDLTTADLHWWQFKGLFDTLSDQTEFVKIMGYRSVEISSKMTAEQQKFYRTMKRRYALPDEMSQSEQQKLDAIEQALMTGGDVQAILEGTQLEK